LAEYRHFQRLEKGPSESSNGWKNRDGNFQWLEKIPLVFPMIGNGEENGMNITVLTAGSRGDVQPFVALGVGLRQAGHHVKICTHSSFEDFVKRYELDYAFMNDEMIRFVVSDQGHRAIEEAGGIFGWLKTTVRVNRQFKPILRRMLDEQWTAAQDADLIIGHPKASGAYDIAEKRNVPLILSLPLPLLTPTREFPVILLSGIRLGGWFNKWSYSFLRYAGAMYSDVFNAWRRETLGLPPRKITKGTLVRSNGSPVPVMYPFSPCVVPRPSDWPDSAAITGYWFLPSDKQWTPPRDLVDFLDAGPPPVYVGFGSIAGKDPRRTAQTVVNALRQSGQRGILAGGWGGLDTADLPDSIFGIQQAPHDWLLPRVSAVVHHGGAGTTAAGLRAGKPAVICPFFGDQPFWGHRIKALGAGPEPIPQKKLTAERLADAIHTAVTHQSMQQRAREIGNKIRDENGIRRAIECIEDQAGI
jgi:sterol 3beta-glucosyltransferase